MKNFLSPFLLLFVVPFVAHAQINALGLASEITHDAFLVGHPVPSEDSSGVVYIYRYVEDTLKVAGELTASDASAGDAFGYQIAAHGDRLAIGAPALESGGGVVYLFTHNAETGTWEEHTKVTGTEDVPIGGSLALTETILVTGGMTGLDSIVTPVNVYSLVENELEHAGTLAPETVQVTDFFGASVAATEKGVIYVGAPGAHEGAGAVYHFYYHEDTWHEEEILTGNHDRIQGRALGASLEISSQSLLLSGAPGIILNVPPNEKPPAGKLVWSDGANILQVLDTGSEEPDLFGLGFSTDERLLLAGAPLEGGQTGAVWSYELDPDSLQWNKTGEITAGEGDVFFGMIISLQGQTAIVSAPASNSGKGVVRVVNQVSETWTLSESLKTGKEIVLLSSGSIECADGIAGQFDCSNVDLLSFMTLEDLGSGAGVQTNDIWGWVDPETNREYALVGRTDGTSFVDITDPANPILRGDLPLTEGANPNSWRDIKVYANHAFIVADNAGEHGMQIFDLTRLRSNLETPETYTEDALYDGIASAHNIVINEATGFAYAVGSSGGGETCGGGLHMIDINDPLSPVFAGCFADSSTGRAGTGYSHDAQCLIYDGPDIEHQGKEICFNSNETALSISDVTDKENPVALSAAEYPDVAYSHQGWITDDFRYFYMNDELDELQEKVVGTRTLIWDVTDLDDPQMVNTFVSDNRSSDHNLYIQGDVMYQSNYSSGLRIFDISDRENPVQIGFFDTYPEGSDKPGFDGSWSNYPFFPSGTIVVTSISEGLFLVRRQNLDL